MKKFNPGCNCCKSPVYNTLATDGVSAVLTTFGRFDDDFMPASSFVLPSWAISVNTAVGSYDHISYGALIDDGGTYYVYFGSATFASGVIDEWKVYRWNRDTGAVTLVCTFDGGDMVIEALYGDAGTVHELQWVTGFTIVGSTVIGYGVADDGDDSPCAFWGTTSGVFSGGYIDAEDASGNPRDDGLTNATRGPAGGVTRYGYCTLPDGAGFWNDGRDFGEVLPNEYRPTHWDVTDPEASEYTQGVGSHSITYLASTASQSLETMTQKVTSREGHIIAGLGPFRYEVSANTWWIAFTLTDWNRSHLTDTDDKTWGVAFIDGAIARLPANDPIRRHYTKIENNAVVVMKEWLTDNLYALVPIGIGNAIGDPVAGYAVCLIAGGVVKPSFGAIVQNNSSGTITTRLTLGHKWPITIPKND